MIYNRSGAQFVYQGITYTIGGKVYANSESVYWESYWESISECAFQLLREYRKQIGKADCFSPEPNKLYPLCVGNGSKECLKCCVYKDMQSEGGS